MITTKERAYLRSLGHDLKDLVFVGKEGVTENVINQINDNLYAHELIKIKVQKNAPYTPVEIMQQICEKINCIGVGVIGSKVLVYKKTTKENFKHLLK